MVFLSEVDHENVVIETVGSKPSLMRGHRKSSHSIRYRTIRIPVDDHHLIPFGIGIRNVIGEPGNCLIPLIYDCGILHLDVWWRLKVDVPVTQYLQQALLELLASVRCKHLPNARADGEPALLRL
jgi:hypothetical protein